MMLKDYNEYQSRLRNLARGLFAGRLDDIEFSDNLQSSMRRAFVQAWIEGSAVVGVDKEDITDEEIVFVQDGMLKQLQYIPGLVQAIHALREAGGQVSTLYLRLDLWAGQYNAVMEKAKLYNAGNIRMVWRLGKTEQHCRDCSALDGKVYSKKTWDKLEAQGIYPKSPTLACRGFNCDCTREPTDLPMTKGKPPIFMTLKHLQGKHDQSTHGRWAHAEENFSRSIRGRILDTTPLKGGIAEKDSVSILFEDGTQGAWKPLETEESILHRGENEVVAYRLSNLLGLNIVPPTEFMDYKGKRGTVQRWEEGEPWGLMNADQKAKALGNKEVRDQIYKTILLDMITGNTDRNTGNFIVNQSKRKGHAIDNGHASWSDQIDTGERTIRNITKIKSGTIKLTPAQLKRLKSITREKFDLAFYGIKQGTRPREVNSDFAWNKLQQLLSWGGISWTTNDAEKVTIKQP